MTRRESRESAFLILFEKIFNDVEIEDIVNTAKLVRNLHVNKFTLEIVEGVLSNCNQIDSTIQKNSNNWDNSRISKVSLLLLRIAVYEILFCSNIPVNVSINEAIELSKKYSSEEETGFINGVLGGVARTCEVDKCPSTLE